MKLFSKSEWKVLWPFYLRTLLAGLFFILIPFEVLYFNSIGLSPTKIGILLAIWPLAALLFEIPTGAISDLYGRKFSVILGTLLMGSVFFSILFFSNYYILLLLYFLLGAVSTLRSGSSEAWVVDLLKKKKMKEMIKNYFAKQHSILNLGFIFSGILGAFLVAKFGIKIIWPVSGFALFISAFFIYFAEEKYEKKRLHIKESFNDLYKQTNKSINYGYKHHVLFYFLLIIFIGGLIAAFAGFISWTPFLKSFNFPDSGFGYLWSMMSIIGVVAPLLSAKFVKKEKERRFLILTALLFLIYGFAVLFANNLILLMGLFLIGSSLGDFEVPIWRTYFHRFIPSKMRATIGSVRVLLFSLAGIIALPLAGFLVDKIGGRYTIFVSSLLIIPVIILYYLMIKREKTMLLNKELA